LSKNKFIDDLGNEYNTYLEYCNSPYLDPDTIYNYLARGKRTPQNKKEEELQEEGKRLIKKGGYNISFN
jgi:hypothetical protein